MINEQSRQTKHLEQDKEEHEESLGLIICLLHNDLCYLQLEVKEKEHAVNLGHGIQVVTNVPHPGLTSCDCTIIASEMMGGMGGNPFFRH